MAAQVDSIESRIGLDSALGHSERRHTVLSSIGGFSQPSNKRIHTLEDLLRYVQSLGLTTFDSSQIEWGNLLGQGVSYKVYGCRDRKSGLAIAVKRVKLPPSSTNYEAFEHRVTCVLRDIEVMHHAPLAQNRNVIMLLGYGWDYERGDTIPYLVTELAVEGTLRQYLLSHCVNVDHSLELCGDVISGLNEIHLCGICHGDVKLDNVLVCYSDRQDDRGNPRPVAKISDFGHSLIRASEQASLSQYRGTVGYAPPETYISDERNLAVDIRKCDLWALGLACWEILADGIPYYETTIVKQALLTTVNSTTMSPDISGTTLRSDGILADLKSTQFNAISGQISSLVEQYLRAETSRIYFHLSPNQQQMCKSFFQALLDPNPIARSALVIHLPLFYEKYSRYVCGLTLYRSIPMALSPREQLVLKNATERQWAFETFKPSIMALTPASAKQKIFQEFQLMTSHRDPLQATRANLHIAYAYGTGFGVAQSLQTFRNIVNKCASEKLQIALPLAECLRDSKRLLNEEKSVKCYNFFVRKFLKQLMPIPQLELRNGNSTYGELENASRIAVQALGSSVTSTPMFAVYYKMTHEIPFGAPVNERLPTSGETALAMACRLGDYQAAINLLDRGADPSIRDLNGCLPLHWLCMFDDMHIETVASRLTQDWGLQYINCKSTAPTIPDPQYPLILHGTALAFATTICSTQAVKTLLTLGADAACGFVDHDPDWGDRSAITLAVSLQLVDMFRLLWSTLPPNLEGSLLCALPKCSIIERYVIHGENYHSARQDMVSLLHKNKIYFNQSTAVRKYAPIEAAVDVMDLDTAETVLKTYYDSQQDAKNHLFLVCINIACRGTLGWQECTSLLDFAVSQGGNINAIFEDDRDAECRAVDILIHRRQGKLLQHWLLEKRPQLTEISGARSSLYPLYDMIENGLSSTVLVEALLLRGADPNYIKPESGHTPLHLAVIKNFPGEVQTLLKYEANPLHLNHLGRSAFYLAISCGNVPMVQEMLKYIDDVNIVNSDEQSPLFLASMIGLIDISTLLLEHGARSSFYDTPGESTALHVAAARGHQGVIQAILRSGQPVDPRDSDDLTPLHLAIESRPYTDHRAYMCAVSFLEAGADPNAYNEKSSYAVHMAFRHFRGRERLDLIKKLHENGARLDVPTSDGTTILHLAAFMRDSAMVKYLLEAGVPATLLGNKGQTPLHDCVRSRSFRIKLRNDSLPQADLEDVCFIARMLAEAGSSAPFRPNARNLSEEGVLDFEQQPKASDHAKASLKSRLSVLIQELRETRIQEYRQRQLETANNIEGYGILLFRDNHSATPFELAALRQSDREVFACLLKIHQFPPQDPKEDPQEEKGKRPISSITATPNIQSHMKVLNAGWTAAINASNWLAVREFLLQKLPVNLRELCWPHGGRLLGYAIENADDELLHLFTGDTAASSCTPILLLSQPNWPKFPPLSNEFSVDLSYLWAITSKFRPARVRDDKNGFRFFWHQKSVLLISSKTREKARKAVLQSYQKSGLIRQASANPLLEIWLKVLGMDFQTANFYLGTTSSTYELVRPLEVPDQVMRDRADINPESTKLFDATRIDTDNSQAFETLMKLIGVSSLEKRPRAWVEDAHTYTCAPGKTSIPFGLVYEVATDRRSDPRRTQRLRDMMSHYRDLVITLEDEDFMTNAIEFESSSDQNWFLAARSTLRRVWIWIEQLYAIELQKPSTGNETINVKDNTTPSIVVTPPN